MGKASSKPQHANSTLQVKEVKSSEVEIPEELDVDRLVDDVHRVDSVKFYKKVLDLNEKVLQKNREIDLLNKKVREIKKKRKKEIEDAVRYISELYTAEVVDLIGKDDKKCTEVAEIYTRYNQGFVTPNPTIVMESNERVYYKTKKGVTIGVRKYWFRKTMYWFYQTFTIFDKTARMLKIRENEKRERKIVL